MNNAAASYRVSKDIYENCSNVVTPECFNWGFSQCLTWIPAKNMRE
jgi:hypothetical protein